ncbi:MAG: M6 family metalloprotease domain-containing protein, partial [Thermoplasmata archaeon]
MLTFVIIGMLGFVNEDPQNSPLGGGLELYDYPETSIDERLYYEGYTTFPPNPEPFILTQPDGTEFTARKVGETVGGHVETLDGYSIVKDDYNWWTYAVKNEIGKLEPTNHRVGTIDPDTIPGLEKHLANDHPPAQKYDFGNIYRTSRAPPLNTTWKGIAIMLQFNDKNFSASNNKTHFSNMLNGTSGATMRTYFREVSYGVFDIEIDVVGPFNSTKDMSFYGADGTGIDNLNGNVFEMAREAVQLADVGTDGFDEDHASDGPDEEVDFSEYDVDGDSVIDALFIIHAGEGQETSDDTDDIWSHKSSIIPAEKVEEGESEEFWAMPYSTEPEFGKIGVFAHEFGHVLGLPDLYDTDYSSTGIGRWGVMGSGSYNGGGMSPAHFSAWSKITLGWVEPIIVTSDVSLTQIVIPPVENNTVIYKMWAHDPSENTDEYFLIENRQKIGFDSALPGDGILIWHIDEAKNNNRNESHYLVDLEEADGAQELETQNGPSQATDPWKNTVTGFRNNTNPNSSSYNGSATFVWVWNISDIAADKNMSIGYNEIYSGPTGIFLSDPISNMTINPVYDFTINDTGFPDEDVGNDTGGNNGSYVLEWRHTNTSEPWNTTPSQTPISWVGGGSGIINCTALIEGIYDFRVKILDEEGHLLYTPIVYNVAVPTKIPPVADAGPDNYTDVNTPIFMDGSGSTDNSGYIAWFNWTFGDGNYHNGTESIYVHIYTEIGNYTVILNVSDSFGNWDTDTVNISVGDSSPPVTNLSIGSPKYRENSGDFWNVTANLTFTQFNLTGVDNYALNFTWYTIDGQFYRYTGNFTLSGLGEGPHNLTWGSEDSFGNNETGNNITVILDNSAPLTDIDVGTPKYRNNGGDYWNVTEATVLTFLRYDKYSGVDYIWYIVNGTPYINGASFTLAGENEGLIPIGWQGFDHVGNSNVGGMWVYLDKSPPQTTLTVGDPKYRAQDPDSWNITDSTTLTLTHNNDGGGPGINFTWYTIDGVYYNYTSPFTLPPGVHTITWGSEDWLGLNETGNMEIINVDVEAPITLMDIGNPKYRKNLFDVINVTDTTLFSLSSSDTYSGVNFTWYLIDSQYFVGTSFNLLGYVEGLHNITYGSIDNLGFNETSILVQVNLDYSPPATIITIGDPKFKVGALDPYNVTSSTSFTLTSLDLHSGVNRTWYTIDGNYYENDLFYLTGYPDGPHTITYGALDNLGINETALTINVVLDNTPPSTLLDIDIPKYQGGPGNPWNVTETTECNLNPVDLYSGVNYTWYTIDGDLYFGLSFNLSGRGDGPHTITWGSVDNLGNSEPENTAVLNLDSTP